MTIIQNGKMTNAEWAVMDNLVQKINGTHKHVRPTYFLTRNEGGVKKS